MIAILIDLEAMSGDILNDYEQAHVTEKMQTTLSRKSGKDARMSAVIVSALSGLKSSGTAFWSHLARCMEFLGYQCCKADVC